VEAVSRGDIEDGLAKSDRLGGHLNGLIIGDEFEGLFE
jgi:hypothetical protein